MDKKKTFILILVISLVLALVPGIVFSSDESLDNEEKNATLYDALFGEESKVEEEDAKNEPEEIKQKDADKSKDAKSAPKLLGAGPAPEPDPGFAYIGTVQDIHYEAKVNDGVKFKKTLYCLMGEEVTHIAPTLESYEVKKYDSANEQWIALEVADPKPEITYLWNDSSTADKLTIASVASTNFENPSVVVVSLNGVELGTFKFSLQSGKIFNSNLELKEDQYAHNVMEGDVIVEPRTDPYYAYIPRNLSKTLKANDIIAEKVGFYQRTEDDYMMLGRAYYEKYVSVQWCKGTTEITTSNEYNATNDAAEDICFKFNFNGVSVGNIDVRYIDGINWKNMINYQPYVNPGTQAKLVYVPDRELAFDSIEYKWQKSNGGCVPATTEVLSTSSELITEPITESKMYMCTVTAHLGAAIYTTVEEVTVSVGTFIDKGIIEIGKQVVGSATTEKNSFDKYSFTTTQTGEHGVDISVQDGNPVSYYICDAEGNVVKEIYQGENLFKLKARQTYSIYVSNSHAYNFTVRNLITCDHSCGTDLIGVTETYSGDKYCKNCELLIEKGHEIKKEEKKEKETSSSSTGGTGDNNNIMLLLIIVIVSAVDAVGFACLRKNKK